MGQDPKLTIILLLVAIAVLIQAGATLGILLFLLKVRREVEAVRAEVKQRLDPIAQSIVEIVAGTREPIRIIAANLVDISRVLRDRTSQIDKVLADFVDRSRLHIIRIDQLISDLIQKVESTAEAVRRQMLGPIQEAAAVIKGVRTGLEFLFARRRVPRGSEATQDEQMFI